MNCTGPRPSRLSYREEEKFFVIYARIVRQDSWPEIACTFEKLFGTRTKGGLTSIYYRVRQEWGLTKVLEHSPGYCAVDRREVEKRATDLSYEFLLRIGYLSSTR
ncbi:hypothetical protein CB0940_05750 [Cercospora beticola]|uniref:Uncharacterized protein n=1 Tax=Cercospora beticola TaxID=122368 RepID=A0A2G5HXJ5_CERBT|nr:hypothetical protein CB0940_05750 [Cercospora beticola]PIA97277.1 hypothetical protein CB0940_05750 [Cercospora beticola]